MFTAPFQAWRRVSIREHRTALGRGGRYLLDAVFQRVMVRFSIRIKSRLCIKRFAEAAQRLASRLELVHTPKLVEI